MHKLKTEGSLELHKSKSFSTLGKRNMFNPIRKGLNHTGNDA